MSSARFTIPVLLSATAAATAALLVSAAAATLQSAATPPAANALVMPRSGLSMDQAVRMVEERYHARVVKAQTAQDEGHTLYVLRLLNDAGKVWTVRVDASSGSVQ